MLNTEELLKKVAEKTGEFMIWLVSLSHQRYGYVRYMFEFENRRLSDESRFNIYLVICDIMTHKKLGELLVMWEDKPNEFTFRENWPRPNEFVEMLDEEINNTEIEYKCQKD